MVDEAGGGWVNRGTPVGKHGYPRAAEVTPTTLIGQRDSRGHPELGEENHPLEYPTTWVMGPSKEGGTLYCIRGTRITGLHQDREPQGCMGTRNHRAASGPGIT